MTDTIIFADRLTKDYGNGRGIFGLDLDVKKGEVFGYIGINGAGKTTTIRHLMGYLKPNSGSSSICGMDSWKESTKIMQNVSYVPGEIAFPNLSTGTDFLKLQARYLGVTDFTYMNRLISILQLDPTANLKRMSKGMKQKTALVAALMGDREILVMDEPTTGLDPLMREAFLDLIKEEKDKGKTIFMSSHIFEEIEDVCDRAAMLKDGHIIDTVSLYELRHPTQKTFELGFPDEMSLEAFKKQLTDSIPGSDVTGDGDNGHAMCTAHLPASMLNQFFQMIDGCHITYLSEKHLSLEEHFMKVYKEVETK